MSDTPAEGSLQDQIQELVTYQDKIATKIDLLTKNVDELRNMFAQFSEKLGVLKEASIDKKKDRLIKLLKRHVDELYAIVIDGKEESCHSGLSFSSKDNGGKTNGAALRRSARSLHPLRLPDIILQIFQYLGMPELANCARVCRLWRDLAATPRLWRHVRMKNSHVSDWGGLFAALRRHGTKRLDLQKMLLPQNDSAFWEQFSDQVSQLDQLERIQMCRCPSTAVEAVCGITNLKSLSAVAIRSALPLDPGPLGALPHLHELRLKSMTKLSLTRDLRPLAALTRLTHLSLTSIKELERCDVVGALPQLESLELGECTIRAEFEFALAIAKLSRLRRLRLERGTAPPALLRALALLPQLTNLELVNFDVKFGFGDALAECKNIQRLLIIPTYVSNPAYTNLQVLHGVLRLKDTLTHLMWGVTIGLLLPTEPFIHQGPKWNCITVRLSWALPNTKLKLLRIPFHETWRQSLDDFH